MSNTIKLKKSNDERESSDNLKKLVIKSLDNINNGSVTIVKQDNCIIQINKYEKYFINPNFKF